MKANVNWVVAMFQAPFLYFKHIYSILTTILWGKDYDLHFLNKEQRQRGIKKLPKVIKLVRKNLEFLLGLIPEPALSNTTNIKYLHSKQLKFNTGNQ